jgi:excisionase family DNA binding protein
VISSHDEFLTVAEVAALLKINQQTVRNWIDAGKLPAVRVGARRVRVTRSDLERFLEQGRTGAGAAAEPSPAHAFWDGEVPEPQLEQGERE